MKNVFPEFYKYSDEEFKDIFSDCYFVIDTNVLLNLYRYSESTRNALTEVLEKIEDKLWMPYQVGLEFHFNRTTVILEQQMAYENICNKINSQADAAIDNIKKGLSSNRHPKIQMDSIENRIKNCFDSLIRDLKQHEEEHPDLLNEDSILNFLNRIYENKVGEPYSKEKLEEIYRDGEERYQKKFPPGYEDEKAKKDKTKEYAGIVYKDKFGDLVVWNQIIDKAQKDEKPIVFVTDDVKEDWWKIEKGRTIGPRIELLNEFRKIAKVPFYMYKTENFTSYIKEYLKEQVNEEAIKEIVDLREADVDREKDKDKLLDEIDLELIESEDNLANYVNVKMRKSLIEKIRLLEKNIESLLYENETKKMGNIKFISARIDYFVCSSAVDRTGTDMDSMKEYQEKLIKIYNTLNEALIETNK
ncbi:hypothetical protein GH839_17280 [Bacillus thuringiensis]|nr:hypothetical protein [Bacillus thuringiensis]TBL13120.1 hypothetical protein EYB35_13280 [Bacillus paranthracis]